MEKKSENLDELVHTIRALRSENGCPWDRKQTTASLVKYLQEEFQEILHAINCHDHQNLCEELGDFLYLIVMISEINREKDLFTIDEVIKSINEKLIRRHPHVFAGLEVSDEKELREQWEQIKRTEKNN